MWKWFPNIASIKLPHTVSSDRDRPAPWGVTIVGNARVVAHSSRVVLDRLEPMSTYESHTEERTARETDDVEVTHTDDVWSKPIAERTKYGTLTGCSYVRCNDCGREVLTGRKEFASHRDECRFGEDTESDERDEPTRHEPADFGGGESTGVQDL